MGIENSFKLQIASIRMIKYKIPVWMMAIWDPFVVHQILREKLVLNTNEKLLSDQLPFTLNVHCTFDFIIITVI
mgnify:CR=1 FL=1